MRVVFVRHGKTDLGARYHFQSPNTPLSVSGADAAFMFAHACICEQNTMVYTSPYERAVETARYIGAACKVTPEEHEFFAEKYNSTGVIGRSYISTAFLGLGLMTILHLFFPHARYRDEETLDMLILRVQKAQTFLETQATREQHIIVVSHSLWIAAFQTCIEKKRSRVWRLLYIVLRAFRIRNLARYEYVYDSVSKVWNRII